jgi:hypothetical protein
MEERLFIINNIISKSPNRLRESYFIKNHMAVYNEIIEFTKNINDIKFPFKVWHWVNNEPNYMRCYCGNKLSAKMNWMDGYKNYCSNKCSSNSESTKEKTKKSLLKKYGVDHYSKTNEYVEKVKQTSIERYGFDNFSKTEDYLIRSKKTYIDKWGVDNFTKTEEYLEKSKDTCLKKYGVEFPTQSENIKQKIKKTNIEKYGQTHIFKSDNYRESHFNICKNPKYVGYVNDMNLFNCDCNQNHTFLISTDDYYGRIKSNNKLCTTCYPISDTSSIKESIIFKYISEIYKSEIITNWRDKFEIDIYLPDINIGFEFNGLYWHSNKFKENSYHLKKTLFFNKKGIRIIHIWEDDWIYKEEIIKSQIKNWIGVTSNKISARKTKVKELKDSSKFLDENHIQGHDRSQIKLGLFYNEELVSLMTFNKEEGRKKMKESEWNLSRFCNKINTTVVGGAGKLLSYFIKRYNPTRIISYADMDWSVGNIYNKLGFNILYETKPDYKYVIGDRRFHKSKFRKSKLNTSLTESQYMKSKDILKVFDCGKIKFEKFIK